MSSSTAFVVPYDPEKQLIANVPDVDVDALWATTPVGDSAPKVGTTRIFYGTPASKVTALSSLGDKLASKKRDEKRELLRKSIGSAVKELKAIEGINELIIEGSTDPHAAAVAAHLSLYKFSLKTLPPSQFNPNLKEPIPEKVTISPFQSSKEWETGITYARAQNLARTLMELPANMLTPTKFTERVKAEFAHVPNVKIVVHDADWASEKGMNTFLSVARGSSEPAKFLEIHYYGHPDKDAKPLALVGKGITFDSGGLSLKPAEGMKTMRGDMGGAAAVVSTALAVAQLQLPINLVVTTPLTENMPGSSAMKPGDIVYAMNGKSVEIDNTDAEGRLVLADAIYYTATEFKPHTLIDVATLTGAMWIALGEIFSGVFSTSDELWQRLSEAGEAEYDRFWRMPLDDDFGPQIHSSNADLQNIGGRPGGSCTAALFLKPFVEGIEPKDGASPTLSWAHIDIGGTMEATRPTPYTEKGMTGRPVRALVEYFSSAKAELDLLSSMDASERVQAAANFLLQSPPGEINDVLNDIRNIIADDELLQEGVLPSLKEYNLAQFITVDVPNNNHQTIVSDAAKVSAAIDGEERFLDPRSKTTFSFDHISLEASDPRPAEAEAESETFRAALEGATLTYLSSNYYDGVASVFAKPGDLGRFIVQIVANKYNPTNYWSGRWRSQYDIDLEEKAVVGKVYVNVHYYEQGNVQLATTHDISFLLPPAIVQSQQNAAASKILALISDEESSYQQTLASAYREMGEKTFKGLRRALPLTRQKMDWDKVTSYKLGAELSSSRSLFTNSS